MVLYMGAYISWCLHLRDGIHGLRATVVAAEASRVDQGISNEISTNFFKEVLA